VISISRDGARLEGSSGDVRCAGDTLLAEADHGFVERHRYEPRLPAW